MPYGTWFGTGRGFGFGGYSPPWPYIGRGRGGLPRCWAYGAAFPYGPVDPYQGGFQAPGMPPFGPQMPPDQELALLKNQTDMLRQHLDQIDARVKELEDSGGSS
jgi:hypothetical protein